MKVTTLAATAALALWALGAAHAAADPKATIADLDARLAKIGAPKVEGTDKAGDKAVPALYFGDRKINNNYDVVDAVRKAHDATATVGTQLAHNKAYEAVIKGGQFCGPIDVLGTAYDACYNPIKDAGGKLIGVSYIGHKQ